MKIGTFHLESTKARISKSRAGKATGEDNSKWKGDDVGYVGIHLWMRRKYGKATTCEREGCTRTYVHWANISGFYKRERDDWMQLCAKHHLEYDGYRRWVGHIKNKDKKCHCGERVLSSGLCSIHYNRLHPPKSKRVCV